jgi:hypothetical protein
MSGRAGVRRLVDEANQKNSEPIEVLEKPIYPPELFEKIREVLRRPQVAAPHKPFNFGVQ